jgi:hypothetical protein
MMTNMFGVKNWNYSFSILKFGIFTAPQTSVITFRKMTFSLTTPSLMTFNIKVNKMRHCCYEVCRFCWLSQISTLCWVSLCRVSWHHFHMAPIWKFGHVRSLVERNRTAMKWIQVEVHQERYTKCHHLTDKEQKKTMHVLDSYGWCHKKPQILIYDTRDIIYALCQ